MKFYLFIYIILIFNIIQSESIFLNNVSDLSYSLSGKYLKHENNQQYQYGLDFGTSFKNNIELILSYNMNKDAKSYNNNFIRSNDNIALSLKYYIKKERLSYILNIKRYEGLNDNVINSINIIAFSLSKLYNGDFSTGMNYYPYINYEYPLNLNTNIDDIKKESFKFIYLGCVITFNNLWVEPFYRISLEDSNDIYSGIKIGVWD